MARKKNDSVGFTELFQIAGVVLMLPLFAISLIFFMFLHLRYACGGNRRRVIDIRRMGAPILKGALLLGTVVIVPLFLFSSASGSGGGGSGGGLIILLWGLTGLAVSMHIAVMYLGVVGDPGKDRLVFSPDMQSYGIFDYLFLRFVLDYCRTDSVPLSDIQRVTRGYGTELYLHGDFGSRCISMSSKQKRDECMAMVQSMAGKGLVFGELESY